MPSTVSGSTLPPTRAGLNCRDPGGLVLHMSTQGAIHDTWPQPLLWPQPSPPRAGHNRERVTPHGWRSAWEARRVHRTVSSGSEPVDSARVTAEPDRPATPRWRGGRLLAARGEPGRAAEPRRVASPRAVGRLRLDSEPVRRCAELWGRHRRAGTVSRSISCALSGPAAAPGRRLAGPALRVGACCYAVPALPPAP